MTALAAAATALVALAAAAGGCGGGEGGAPRGWADGVALPIAADLDPSPGVVEIELEARVADVPLVPGGPTPAWTYGGTVPGPLLRARVGDRLVVRFTNHLPAATTIHWHGVRVPAAMDGVGVEVPAGGRFVYDFTLPDAGTFWYHPHVDSAAQVGFGLYGPLVVEGPEEPSGLGDEAVLVLSDAFLRDDGSLGPPTAGGDVGGLFGREGNVLLVNGRVRPRLLARQGQRQRWRLVNAAKSRYFWLELAGHTFVRIGGDGGLREEPLPLERLLLVPGERADVLVTPTAAPGQATPLVAVPFDRGYGSTFGREPSSILDLEVVADGGEAQPLPGTLRRVPPLAVTGAISRDLELTQDDVEGVPVLGFDHQHGGHHALVLEGRVDTTELWTVRNSTDWHHPFHLHGFFFQVLGDEALAGEWKDMIDVPEGEARTFVVRYDDRPGDWMFHCHILDHADMGMMGVLRLAR